MNESLSPTVLQARACNLTGLDDFGPDITPALAAFQVFFGDVELTQHGLQKLTSHAIRALVTRLRLIEASKKTPQTFAGRLNDPLIIVGLPRTGTTYLHQLLAALPKRRFLTSWEVMEPIPDAQDDNRIEYYQHLVQLAVKAAPELALKHHVDALGPEECMFLLDPSMVSLSFVWFDAPCRGYLEWVHDPIHREPYDIYRKLLLYLQSSSPERQLVLKSPAHFSQLAALLRAVPEARLVHTHRDPVQALASACSLRETILRPCLKTYSRREIGKEMLEWFETVVARNAAEREQLPPGVNFDLQFDELTREPLASIERLYRHFGLEWTEQEDAALRAELTRDKPQQVGQHHYDLQDYGLDAGEVAARLEPYRRRWGFT